MAETLLAIGRGIVKLLISLFVGFGVGLVVVGYFSMQRPGVWDKHEVPFGETCLGVGAGLLTAAITLSVLFFSTRARRSPPPELPH